MSEPMDTIRNLSTLGKVQEYVTEILAETDEGKRVRGGVNGVRAIDSLIAAVWKSPAFKAGDEERIAEAKELNRLKHVIGSEVFHVESSKKHAKPVPMKTVTVELVVRMQVPEDTNLTHLAVARKGVVIPLIEGEVVLNGTEVTGYPTHPVQSEHLTYQHRITEGDYRLGDEPTPMLDPKEES